ncbi:MAG: hypothetical protein ACI4QD_05055 [Kiritimatiellia bacterium]
MIALNFGLVPEAARGKVVRSLAALIRANGTRLATGFLGYFVAAGDAVAVWGDGFGVRFAVAGGVSVLAL